jgi:hypothetical protein
MFWIVFFLRLAALTGQTKMAATFEMVYVTR